MKINSTKKKITLSFVLAIVFFALSLFTPTSKISKAKAQVNRSFYCQCTTLHSGKKQEPFAVPANMKTVEEARAWCEKHTGVDPLRQTQRKCVLDPGKVHEKRAEYHGVESDNFFVRAIKWLLLAILELVGTLLTLAGIVFAWSADAKNISYVLGNSVLFESWGYVRDVFNVFFILVLLLIAFSMIFQVEKYGNKKTIVTLIIMALLVNFSFPLVRIIIDFSNVLMYSLLQTFLPFQNDASEIFVNITEGSEIKNIINPGKQASIPFLISAIIFVFILAITLLALAALLVIRIMALAVLIIFSPIGFIGIIVPGISSQVSKFWDNLLRFSFFGPIMVFMLIIAVRIMSSIGKFKFQDSGISFQEAAEAQSIEPSILASMSVFIIPIIILWMGMGVASSMSIIGADIVTSKAKNLSKNLGRKISLAPVKLAGSGWKTTGIPGGIKQKWEDYKKSGPLFGTAKIAKREAKVATKLGVTGAAERDVKIRADEYKKNNESKDNLQKKVQRGDAAAAYRLAIDGNIDSPTYEQIIKKIKDPKVKELLENKTSETRIDTVIDYKIKTETEAARAAGKPAPTAAEEDAWAEEIIGKLKPDQWKNQNIKELTDKSYPYHAAKISAAYKVYNGYNRRNQDKVTENMSGENYAAGSGFIW